MDDMSKRDQKPSQQTYQSKPKFTTASAQSENQRQTDKPPQRAGSGIKRVAEVSQKAERVLKKRKLEVDDVAATKLVASPTTSPESEIFEEMNRLFGDPTEVAGEYCLQFQLICGRKISTTW